MWLSIALGLALGVALPVLIVVVPVAAGWLERRMAKGAPLPPPGMALRPDNELIAEADARKAARRTESTDAEEA